MNRQIMVIGLGQFGMGLVRALSNSDVEIIAVDLDEKRVEMASSWVAKPLCVDATNEDSLAQLHPEKRDVCVCATGDQSREVGIICTALLKQLGAKRIIARANDDLHARILHLVGADEVVNPEWDFGERYAPRILSKHVLGEMLLGADLVVSEINSAQNLWDKRLKDLNLQRRFGITVIAIREGINGKIKQVGAEDIIKKGDILVTAARRGSIHKLLEDVE